MFKRVLAHKGFWKSVLILAIAYSALLFLIQYLTAGFSLEFIDNYTLTSWLFLLLAGSICGFFVTYGKFWGKLKNEDYKNR
ncbi:hypothetical protein [Patiriisocius hiemis]|uniref:Uncharacterized protein n=1 Tax=Patiriisocius hiemis TaxID=3075604 RepID=A0ABU2YC68_9FLAO|nr:hypothetical protein [Constantimarinum sp. W242]MDT0555784.1 hypothetical protein [Constantimarinum sp. W242]